MTGVLLLTVNQIALLAVFMLAGYFLAAGKLVDKQITPSVSKLINWIFLPALIINTFAQNFKIDKITEYAPFLIVGAVVLALVIPLSFLSARLITKDSYARKIYLYSFIAPNLGYFGYPLVNAVFGPEMLLKYTILTTPFNIFIFSAGINMFKGDGADKKFGFKSLLTPPLIALIIGIALGLLPVELPAAVGGILSAGAACMAPLAMILTGIVLSKRKISEAFAGWRNYAASGIRLILIPSVFFGLFMLIRLFAPIEPEWIVLTIACLCLPLGLNVVIFPEYYNRDSAAGAQANLISNIFGLITIPIAYSLISLIL